MLIWLCEVIHPARCLRYPSKAFCFIGLLVYTAEFQWLFEGINAPFKCRPRSWGGGGGDPRRESMHGIWKSDVRGVSGGEEFSQNADTTLEWNIKCSNLLCDGKNGALLFQMAPNLQSPTSHFPKRGSAKRIPLWEKSQAFMDVNEVSGEQMCSTPEMKLQPVILFHSREQEGPFFQNAYSSATIQIPCNTRNEHRLKNKLLCSHYFSSNLI